MLLCRLCAAEIQKAYNLVRTLVKFIQKNRKNLEVFSKITYFFELSLFSKLKVRHNPYVIHTYIFVLIELFRFEFLM